MSSGEMAGAPVSKLAPGVGPPHVQGAVCGRDVYLTIKSCRWVSLASTQGGEREGVGEWEEWGPDEAANNLRRPTKRSKAPCSGIGDESRMILGALAWTAAEV